MYSLIDLCFLCTKDYNNCVLVKEKVISQVEYLLPEITIIKIGVPLRICSACDGALCAFSKFKQSSVESSRRLEASIKGAQGPSLLTSSPIIVDDNETSGAKPEKMEEIFIKEEYVEEPPLDTQMHTDRASLNPIALVESIIVEPQNQNMQLHTDTNTDNIEEIFIKEEQKEETPLDREFYSNILKEEYVINSINVDTDSQPRHNTEDQIATKTSEKNWEEEKSFTDFEQETVEETDGNHKKNFQTGTKETTHTTINQDQIKNIQNKKDQLKVLSCTVCKKVFIHKYDLDKHMDLHSGIKNYSCPICKKRFFNSHNFKQHIKNHPAPKESKRNFQCEICDQLFVRKAHLMRHTRIHSGVKDFQCETCKKLFASKSSLNDHMNIHLGVRDFPCQMCEKSFIHQHVLNRHMKIHLGVKDFECEVCKKSFTASSSLSDHMKIHLGVKEYLCEICEKSFTKKANLTTHMKTHTGEKEYQCEMCEKSFSAKTGLNHHMRSHTGIKEYKCEVCSKLIATRQGLSHHMKIHLGVKEYECEICKKLFIQKNNLMRHMKIHSDVKEFQCEVCDKSFTVKCYLTSHMQVHSELKDVQCDICGKSVTRKYLRAHMKMHSSSLS